MRKPKPSMKIVTAPPEPRGGEAAASPPAPIERAPHVSVYISRRVQKEFKQLALDYDRKVQELYLEGMDAVLRQYGRPSIAELDQGKP
jgi:hypothetical protein